MQREAYTEIFSMPGLAGHRDGAAKQALQNQLVCNLVRCYVVADALMLHLDKFALKTTSSISHPAHLGSLL